MDRVFPNGDFGGSRNVVPAEIPLLIEAAHCWKKAGECEANAAKDLEKAAREASGAYPLQEAENGSR